MERMRFVPGRVVPQEITTPPGHGQAGAARWNPDYLALLCALAAYLVWVMWVGFAQTALGYTTGVDFILGFIPEAKRFLAGAPLLSNYHPPLYPMLLGGAFLLTNDWVSAAQLLSFTGGAGVLVAAFALCRGLYGRPGGWGALVGLAAAPGFLAYAVTPSSDVLFSAVFLGACACAVAAVRTQRQDFCAATGLLIGCAVLLRTNGITLFLLVALPLLGGGSWRARIRQAAVMGFFSVLPIAAMLAFTKATGSSIRPVGTVDNLAMTLYVDGPDRGSGDAIRKVQGRFRSVSEVLLHDPVRVVRVYANDLLQLLLVNLPRLVSAPLTYVFAPGLIWLLLRRSSPLALGVLIALLAQTALLNFKEFDARYYIFVPPILGAGIAATLQVFLPGESTKSRFGTSGPIMALAVVLSLAGFFMAGRAAIDDLATLSREPAELITRGVPGRIPPDAVVVARKPQLAFYAGATNATVSANSLGAVRDELAALGAERPVFLFVGQSEAVFRPGLAELRDPGAAPPWLALVEWSGPQDQPANRWALYRFQP